jgi:flagellar biosynthesis protein FlhB
MYIIAVFVTLLIAIWAFIWIYFKQRKQIDLLKKELRALPKSKDVNPDVKAIAKELKVSYERAEEIYKRARIL